MFFYKMAIIVKYKDDFSFLIKNKNLSFEYINFDISPISDCGWVSNIYCSNFKKKWEEIGISHFYFIKINKFLYLFEEQEIKEKNYYSE